MDFDETLVCPVLKQPGISSSPVKWGGVSLESFVGAIRLWRETRVNCGPWPAYYSFALTALDDTVCQ